MSENGRVVWIAKHNFAGEDYFASVPPRVVKNGLALIPDYRTDGWSITHLRTGTQVCHGRTTLKDAREVFRILADSVAWHQPYRWLKRQRIRAFVEAVAHAYGMTRDSDAPTPTPDEYDELERSLILIRREAATTVTLTDFVDELRANAPDDGAAV